MHSFQNTGRLPIIDHPVTSFFVDTAAEAYGSDELEGFVVVTTNPVKGVYIWDAWYETREKADQAITQYFEEEVSA